MDIRKRLIGITPRMETKMTNEEPNEKKPVLYWLTLTIMFVAFSATLLA